MRLWLMMAGVSALFVGCTSYDARVVRRPAERLNPGDPVTILVPKPGWYGETCYRKSGKMTADALEEAFDRHARAISQTRGPLHMRPSASGYVVKPVILHWEERATEWSGKPDRIAVKIEVLNANDLSVRSSVVVKGKSKWFTFGGDHPQDLLAKPIRDYVDSLY